MFHSSGTAGVRGILFERDKLAGWEQMDCNEQAQVLLSIAVQSRGITREERIDSNWMGEAPLSRTIKQSLVILLKTPNTQSCSQEQGPATWTAVFKGCSVPFRTQTQTHGHKHRH